MRREPRVGDLGLAAGRTRWWTGCCVELFVRLDVRVGAHDAARLGDGDVLNLRIEPLDLDAQVLLERQLHRLVDRQPAHRAWLPATAATPAAVRRPRAQDWANASGRRECEEPASSAPANADDALTLQLQLEYREIDGGILM